MFTWPGRRQPPGDGIADSIGMLAEQCAAEFYKQINAQPTMEVAELRGYVRARLDAIVRRRLRLAMTTSHANEPLSAGILARVVERAVYLVVREHLLRSQLPVVRRAAA